MTKWISVKEKDLYWFEFKKVEPEFGWKILFNDTKSMDGCYSTFWSKDGVIEKWKNIYWCLPTPPQLN